MATNPDFKDLFSALFDEGAEFIVVGAHAVMYYTEPRFTKDLDVWVRPTSVNAALTHRALSKFGAPMNELSVEDLAVKGTIFQIGVAPNRIDIITSIEGVEFEAAWPRRVASTYSSVPIAILGLSDLQANKRAVGRPQDKLDLEKLERVGR